MKLLPCLHLAAPFFAALSLFAADEKPAPLSIAAALQPFVESHSLAGAVALVASKDKVLAVETVGFADIAAQKPMTPDTMFWIASQSKAMTASALMILVDEGKVNVDDPVEKYLPEFHGQMVAVEQDAEHLLLRKPAHPITVREVLNHTSGLPFKSPLEMPTLDGLPLSVAVRSYGTVPLKFEPGTKWDYSNAGINTAGRIVEVVSGMSYEDFMQKRLFDPLDMKDTTFWPNEEQTQRLAKSYKPNADKTGLEETKVEQLIYPLSDRARRFPMPAGGLFSTANDVARYCQMLLNGGALDGRRILSEASVKQMTTKQTAAAVEHSYGFGLDTGGGNFGHGGAFATNMEVNPRRNLITIWMVQHAGFPSEGGKSHGAFKQAADRFYGSNARPFLCCDYNSDKVSRVSADGTVEWEFSLKHPQDCWALPNGNYLFAHATGAVEITPAKQIVWEYKAPEKVEVDACQPLPDGRVMVLECGTSRIVEVDREGKIAKEIKLETLPTITTHEQFRGTRKSKDGHYFICFKGEHKIVELDGDGKVLRNIAVPGDPHEVVPLADGHLLVTCGDGHRVLELDAQEKIVWQLDENDLPGNPLRLMAGCQRLPNGNTVFCNYLGHGHVGQQPQFFEITPDKKIVWQFGDSRFQTINQVQMLDIPGDVTKGEILR